jgi:ribosomal protein S18 acetylase RimI-like enzyme
VAEPDLPELSRLDREVFGKHAYPYFMLRQLYDMYAQHLLVLDDGAGLRGYVLAGTTLRAERCWILGLAVAADGRGRGLGRMLMLEILERLRGEGVREVLLTVEPANVTAIVLYRSLGFVPAEPDEGFRKAYFGPGEDRIVMRLMY